MLMHKITLSLSEIKKLVKNTDMTEAMQILSQPLSQVKMTKKDTLAMTSNANCVYRLLTVFQTLLFSHATR